tara:strand:- start:474 stop:914 length:441 start_codon:yes stop_codon:yes gene_type:complete
MGDQTAAIGQVDARKFCFYIGFGNGHGTTPFVPPLTSQIDEKPQACGLRHDGTGHKARLCTNIMHNPNMRLLHSSIARFFIVHMQRNGLNLIHENNPPDGFLEYRRGLHPPPEDLFYLGGGISLLPDVVALFFTLVQSGSQAREVM